MVTGDDIYGDAKIVCICRQQASNLSPQVAAIQGSHP